MGYHEPQPEAFHQEKSAHERQPAQTTPPPPPADPHDLLAEGARARKLSGELEGVKCMAEGIRLINNTILTHVLFALWDSGFYEYSLTHPRFNVAKPPRSLAWTLKSSRCCSTIWSAAACCAWMRRSMELTEYGSRLSNVVVRGAMNLNLGGYSSQLTRARPAAPQRNHPREI